MIFISFRLLKNVLSFVNLINYVKMEIKIRLELLFLLSKVMKWVIFSYGNNNKI